MAGMTKGERRRLALYLTSELSGASGTPTVVSIGTRNGEITAFTRATMNFPSSSQAAVDAPDTAWIEDAVSVYDELMRECVNKLGGNRYSPEWHPWNREGNKYILAHHFPPIFGDESPDIFACFRRLSPEEEAAIREERGDDCLFSDERWVETRYAGINIFRGFCLPMTTNKSVAPVDDTARAA